MLSVLLLRANRLVTVDDLIDAVWGESQPSTARGQIQICVSRLRRDIGEIMDEKIILTRSGGYLCQVDENELDVKLFDAHVHRANALAENGPNAKSAEQLRKALGLWRGRVLSDASGKARLLAESLEEKRVSVLENRIELDLSLGHHQELVSELVELVAEHPLREHLRGYLMVALYRSGRQADALEVYRTARRELIEELGIEPSETLRELESSILAGDEQLCPAEPTAPQRGGEAPREHVPQQLPADTGDFTGRVLAIATAEEELRHEAKRPRTSNAVRMISISGRGGIGKTALAVHVAHRLRDSYPDGQLFACVHGDRPDPAETVEILRRFLRGTGVPSTALPTDIDDLQDMYRSQLSGKRILVVLDDVASERQLAPLLPGSPTCSVIVTSRRKLGNLPGARRVDLEELESKHARTLLSHLVGPDRAEAEPESLRQLVELCGRWPLAIRIIGARLAARPHMELRSMVDRLTDEQHRLDEMAYDDLHVRSTLTISYEGLSDEARALFRLLALCGAADFAAWTPAALLDTSCARAEDLLDELVGARLLDIVDSPTGTRRYAFHDLVRIYAREKRTSLDSAESGQVALRRLLGAFLALAREAHRRLYGGDYTVLHGSGQLWRLSDSDVDRVLTDPIGWFETERSGLVASVHQAADIGADDVCWDLALTSVTLFEARGYVHSWQETHDRALDAVRQAGNKRGEAAVLCSLGSLWQMTRGEAGMDGLEEALRLFEELDDLHGQALTLRNLAFFDRSGGRFDRASQRYERAIDGFRVVDDPVAQAHALINLAQVHLDLLRFEQAHSVLDESLVLCRRTGNRRVEAQAWQRLGDLYLQQDRLEEAGDAFGRVLDLVLEMGDRVGEVYALCGLGVTCTRRNQLAEAERLLRQALETCEVVSARLGTGRVLLALGWLHMAQRELDSADEYLRQASDSFEDLRATLWQARTLDSLAEVRMRANQPQAAKTLWSQALELLKATASPESARISQRADSFLHRAPAPKYS